MASARGLDTNTNEVCGPRKITDTSAARLRKPSSMPARERKNSMVSSTTFGPASLRINHKKADEPALVTLANERDGIVSTR